MEDEYKVETDMHELAALIYCCEIMAIKEHCDLNAISFNGDITQDVYEHAKNKRMEILTKHACVDDSPLMSDRVFEFIRCQRLIREELAAVAKN